MRSGLFLLACFFLFPATGWSQLYFPRLVSSTELSTTGYALVNPNDTHAGVALTFHTDSGIPLSNAQVVIPPGGQLARLGSELFANMFTSGWVQATSNVPLQGFWLGGDFSTYADGGSAASATRDQIFPLVAGQTEINIANAAGVSNAVTIRVRDADGADMAASVTRTIAGNGAFQVQVSTLFPGVNLTLARHVRVTSALPAVGTSVIRGFLSSESAVLNSVDSNSTLTQLNFPHVVSGAIGGANYSTVLGVTNLSSGAQTVTFTFHPEASGAPISVQRNVSVAGSIRDTAQSLFNFPQAFQDGWVQVSGTAPLTGFAAYADTVSGGLAVVPVQPVPKPSMVFAHVAGQPTWYTGVGLLNTGTVPADVEVYTMSAAGSLTGGAANVPTASFSLPAGRKVARLLSEFIPPTVTQNGGFVFVRTANGVPLYGMELFGSLSGRIIANVAAGGVPPGINYSPPPPVPPPGPPVILVQPVNTNVTAGQPATFSLTTTGSPPLAYQWKRNGVDIPGATEATFSTPPATVGDNGAVYTVVVSNGLGTVTSTPITLAVVSGGLIPFISTQPVSFMSISVGGIPEFSVTATGVVPTYQWRKNGVPIPGATAATYIAPAAAPADDDAVYNVMVCTVGGCRTSLNVVLEVVDGTVSPVRQFDAGGLNSVALREDGTVWGWGTASNGFLALNRPITYPAQGIPVQAVDPGNAPFKNVVRVSATTTHTLALRSDGTVWATGPNANGDLGTASNISYFVFALTLTEPGIPFVEARYVHASLGNSYAITEDGSAWAWGNNVYSQIGDGTSTNRNVPTRVTDAAGNAFKNVIAAAGGGIHTLWLRNDGTVWAAGTNTNGSLGDGTGITRANPVRVELSSGVPLTNIVAISAAGNQSAALRNDGTVFRWGGGTNRPVQVPGLTGVTAIESGGGFTLCLLSDGTVVEVGAGPGFPPALVRNADGSPFSGVRRISTETTHRLAQKVDGTLWAWGDNNSKRLGDGTAITRLNPVRVQGMAP